MNLRSAFTFAVPVVLIAGLTVLGFSEVGWWIIGIVIACVAWTAFLAKRDHRKKLELV
jgi:hypothetical protein